MRRKYPGRPYRTATVGNTLTEYGIIGFIVLGLSWLALSNMGDFVSTLFKNMLGQKPSPTAQVAAPPSSVSPPTDTEGPLTSDVQVTLGNGTTLDLSSYPLDFTESVVTSGANGTTNLLANTLKSLSQQLLEKGEINQDQFNTLIALANQGHRMAKIQKVIETMALNSTSSNKYYNSVFNFDGQTYTVDEISMMIGFDYDDPSSISDPLTDPNGGAEVIEYQMLFQQAVNSGALNDPTLNQVIRTLSSQIISLSALTEHASYNIAIIGDPPDSIRENITSNLNNKNAAGICGAGNGVDNGVQCASGG